MTSEDKRRLCRVVESSEVSQEEKEWAFGLFAKLDKERDSLLERLKDTISSLQYFTRNFD